MKKLFTLALFICLSLCSWAQYMNVESFVADPSDMDARVHFKKVDQNGRTAAIIKIQTTEKGFAFDVGTLGVVAVEHDKVAETWVYVPHSVRRLSVKHPKLGSMDYEFEIPIKEATVYKLKLTSSKITTIIEQTIAEQYLIVKIQPQQAEITIDGGVPQIIEGGVKSLLLSKGEHTYSVSAPMYITSSGTVNIGETKTELPIKLVANYGYLAVESNVFASVEINNIKVGTTPYRSDMMQLGTYNVKVSADKYEAYQAQVTLSKSEKAELVSVKLVPYFSNIKLSTMLDGASIFINKEFKANNSWNGELLPGTYEIEVKKDGYRDYRRTLQVERNRPQDITLDSPTPMYGKIKVDGNVYDAEVSWNGKMLGKSPDFFSDILVGAQTFTFSKLGYDTVTKTVEIKEGEIAECYVTLTQTVVKYTPKQSNTYTPTSKSSSSSSSSSSSRTSKSYSSRYKSKSKSSRSRVKIDSYFGFGMDLDFADNALSVTLPTLSYQLGGNENLANFVLGFQYRIITGSNGGDIYYDELNYNYVYPYYAVANQLSVPLYVRFNMPSKKKDNRFFIGLGAVANYNINGYYKYKDTEDTSEDAFETKLTLDDMSIVNPISFDLYGQLGFNFGAKSNFVLALVVRYNLTPTFNVNNVNTYIESDGSVFNLYELYPDLKTQVEDKFFIGATFSYAFKLK